MSADTLQRLAVSCLVGECESLVASGDLNESQEKSLRLLIAHTLAAFGMPSKPERAANTNTAPDMNVSTAFDDFYSYDEIITILREQMGTTL